MKRSSRSKFSLFLVAFMLTACAVPGPTKSGNETVATKDEIEQLRQDITAMKSELAEIRKLVQQGAGAPREAPSAFKPQVLAVGDSPVLGGADAAVTLFAYSDYQCPFCGRHATTVLPRLVNEYVDSGKLRIVMREYPIEAIHPRAFAASLAAHCAGKQDRYWAMHDLIFADQRSLADEDFKAHAAAMGLNEAAFDECLASEDAGEQIRSEIQEAYALGISGTPSFVAGLSNLEDGNSVHVTEYIRGAQAFERFRSVIEGLLEESATGQ